MPNFIRPKRDPEPSPMPKVVPKCTTLVVPITNDPSPMKYSSFIPDGPAIGFAAGKKPMEEEKRNRKVESYPDEGEMAQYHRHRKEGCQCCSLHSIFARQVLWKLHSIVEV